MSLSRSQIAVLATICTPIASQDDLTRYLNVPGRDQMIKALEEEQAKIQAASAKEAALSIISLSKQVEEAKAEYVNDIRRLRSQIESRKESLDKLDRLLSYGEETGNYLPLVACVEGYHSVMAHVTDRSMLDIPENWKPSAAKTTSKAVASAGSTSKKK